MGESRSQSHLASKAKSYQVQHIEEQFSDIFITGENIVGKLGFFKQKHYRQTVYYLKFTLYIQDKFTIFYM